MRRNAINVIAGLFIIAVFGLAGCGGGGGGGTTAATPTPTPTGTTVNLTTVKGFYGGTAATGSQMSFTLTGSDTSGNAYNGSFAVVSDGTTTFEGQNVTKSRNIFTRTATGVSATSIDTMYFLASNGNYYKSVDSSGVTGVPSAQTPIADNVHVGDFGNMWNVTKSDGTSESVTWKLEADFNGNSKFTFSTVIKNSSNVVTGLVDQTFYLDSTGNPYKFALTITIPSSGITITMSGNRSDVTPVTAVGTEVWVGSNGQGNTNTTLTKNADGTITTTGQWTYNYNGATVTCQITGGNTTISGNNVTITGTGTATNPTVPAGYQTSPFTLLLTGTMSGGQGSGKFTITFQTSGWPAPISGDWTAQKQSGSGVTNTTTTQPIGISITPTAQSVTTGGQVAFTSTVTGTTNTSVTWSVLQTGGGTITTSGVYTAPATAGTYQVKVVSAADSTKSATATVTVTTTSYSGTWRGTGYSSQTGSQPTTLILSQNGNSVTGTWDGFAVTGTVSGGQLTLTFTPYTDSGVSFTGGGSATVTGNSMSGIFDLTGIAAGVAPVTINMTFTMTRSVSAVIMYKAGDAPADGFVAAAVAAIAK